MRPGRAGRPGIVVPVHDEAALLPRTVPPLLDEAAAIGADLVFVCNGCSDGSAALLRRLAGGRARVLELPRAGKAAALRAGEGELVGHPRFFVDADVVLGEGCLVRLRDALARGEADLVAPRLVLDLDGCSPAAAAVSRVWAALPHLRREGFHNVLGLGRAGRRRVGPWPELCADDAFAAARIAPARRRIVAGATATIRPPRDLRSWVGVRRRWKAGHRELGRHGMAPPRTPGQRRALLGRLLAPRTARGAALYLLVGLAGRLPTRTRWFRDGSSRAAAPSPTGNRLPSRRGPARFGMFRARNIRGE